MIKKSQELNPCNVKIAEKCLRKAYKFPYMMNIDLRNALQIALRVLKEYQKTKGGKPMK